MVAPETDQSGVAHSLSLNDPLRLRKISRPAFRREGHADRLRDHGGPAADAEHRPDLVLSGVNRGQNIAEDVTYSGTVAGAIEGTILGVPSIALSQAYGPAGRQSTKWRCAEHHGPAIVRKLLETGIDKGILVNVNFPDCEPDEVEGAAIVNQGQRNQELLRLDERQGRAWNPYFWIAFERRKVTPGNGTDLWAIANRRIAITPLRLDMTDEPTLTRFAQAFS